MTPRKIVPKGAKQAPAIGPSTPALAEADVTTIEIVGKRGKVKIDPLTCKLERTIEGASSLIATVHDPDLMILNSAAIQPEKPGTFEVEGDTVVDGLVWALTGITILENHILELVFEDAAVKALRTTKPLTMSRGKVTRAQFIKRMFDDAGVPFFCPELDIKQRIEKPQEAESEAEKHRKRKPGLASHASLMIKGQPIDDEQRENLEIALSQAVVDHAGSLATLALICGGIGESGFRKNATDGVYHTHHGVWQSNIIPGDQVAQQAHYFLIGGESFQGGGAIALAAQGLSAGEIATKVEDSGEPAEFYGVYQAEAEKIIQAFTGGDLEGLTGETVTVAKEYQFQRKAGETSWACARRLAEEVNWYLFIEGGVGYYFSGPYLRRSKPRMLVAPGADGIDKVTSSAMNSNEHDDTLTVTCHAKMWEAPPGSIAQVQGYGPFDNRWDVSSIIRPRMASDLTTITLGTVKHAKPEPAHETETRTAGEGAGNANGTSTPTASWNPSHKPIAAWIVPILAWASTHGWGGVVTSGYRTNAEQETAARNYGLQHYGPGGPLASNHCGNQNYPKGAVDVTEAAQLNQVLKGYTGPKRLIWAQTTIEDGVHFSADGH